MTPNLRLRLLAVQWAEERAASLDDRKEIDAPYIELCNDLGIEHIPDALRSYAAGKVTDVT